MYTRESESERRNNDFFRFAERAQTDFGVGAVINWAREADLGPEVFFISFKSDRNLLLQDLFISGDVDEVMSRKALHQLKWCQVKEDVITGDSLSNVTLSN